MKASLATDLAAAFPDATHRPDESELPGVLGEAFPPVGEVLNRLHAHHPDVTSAWQYSGQVGWYQVQLLKKRRLLYLVPKRGNFRLAIILGGKAVATLKAGPLASRVTRLLKNTRHYPEGTMFEFDRTSLDPDLLTDFLEAKLNPTPSPAMPA